MSKRDLYEFLFLCKMAGFKNLDEVMAYMKKEGINWRQLFNELDALLFPEFINYYNVASFDGIYNTEALTAFAIYFILKSYLDKEDGTDEKESMEKLARLAAKFMKFGNLKLDKLLSNLRKPERSSEEKLKDFAAKHADKFSENQVTEKSDSKKDSEQSEQ